MKCNQCLSNTNIVKNNKRKDGKQSYLCKSCNHQFIKDEDRVYFGKIRYITESILRLLLTGVGVRSISKSLLVSTKTVLKVLIKAKVNLHSKKKKYQKIIIDELWSYVQNKKINSGLFMHFVLKAKR